MIIDSRDNILILVINPTGEQVYSEIFYNTSMVSLNLKSLPKGFYLIHLTYMNTMQYITKKK